MGPARSIEYVASIWFTAVGFQMVRIGPTESLAYIVFSLPLKNVRLLKRWVHVIRRTNHPQNRHTRICSKHFVNAEGRRLYPDEVPSLFLPRPSISSSKNRRKPPRDRSALLNVAPATWAAEQGGQRGLKPPPNNNIAGAEPPNVSSLYGRGSVQTRGLGNEMKRR